MTLAAILLSVFTIVQLNCENLFDCAHDTLKADYGFLPQGNKHWSKSRYWKKLNNIGREIIACGGEGEEWALPDLVALCEVENDSVMRDLTRRSLLRNARYEYVMTNSPDRRGIDVALLYSPFSFALLESKSLRIAPQPNMSPTRDILYAKGITSFADTLHVFVVHSPSRSRGEIKTRPFRMAVARRLCSAIDSIRAINSEANIIISGDFNDYGNATPLALIAQNAMTDVSQHAVGRNGSKGTYRYKGEWNSLDHIFVTQQMANKVTSCEIYDAPFLLEDEAKYGGKRPWRTFVGPKYLGGYSDHLPLVVRFLCNPDLGRQQKAKKIEIPTRDEH